MITENGAVQQKHEPVVSMPVRSLLGVQVLATGSYIPEQIVTNEDLKRRLGFDPDWIVQRTGIRERRFAPQDMATSDMAYEASKCCLEQAGVSPDEIDLVIVGTFTPDRLCPSTACMLQDRLGIQAPAMDLQAACAGFMYAMVTGMQYVANGCSQKALIVGADCNSRIINPRDQRTYPLFGDGAGAVLLAPGDDHQGLMSYSLGSDGSGADLLTRPMGGTRMPAAASLIDEDMHYLQMDGRAVFKWAVRLVSQTVREVLAPTGVGIEDVDLFVFHQANQRIIRAAASELGMRDDQIFINLDRYGNTSGASIPLALDEAWLHDRFDRDSLVLVCGFGAGLTWGTALMKW
ncbi:3-oxoacyl-[acyl-carrier-protein] synthase 3 [Planctomycetales bacterium 10988]|nr:3-oxoacyl-[acyl-carrier-protein] synthase 3 [Planctomycetales bacterium 10988]